MKLRAAEPLEVEMKDLEAILLRARSTPLSEPEYAQLQAALQTLGWLAAELERKNVSVARLQRLLFGSASEKTSEVLAQKESSAAKGSRAQEEKKEPRPGHGRHGAAQYVGATPIDVPHETLRSGDPCPDCHKGKVYEDEPRISIRVSGQAPLPADAYRCQVLRCNTCGKEFAAKRPEGAGDEKYHDTAAAMIALLKYGTGLPFHRLEKLEGNLGIPLPSATQWEVVEKAAGKLEPVLEELIHQAAQGQVIHNDDTPMKILALGTEEPAEEKPVKPAESERTGVFTSGILSKTAQHEIALFFTGQKHAGENLTDVLKQRADELDPPIQMCDGLSRNEPEGFETLLANCNAHGRRKFVDLVPVFPEECRTVLESLKTVYQVDARAKAQKLSDEERLRLHQAESGPVMAKLEEWMKGKMERKEVEPNSPLGEAIGYLLKRWEPLTLFLRKPGAPLDNNLCERALKRAILHRKNALFYKTENGAWVGDLFMSLIHTAELGRVNPFDYLTELLRHPEELKRDPASWMPWNYGATLANLPHAPPPSP